MGCTWAGYGVFGLVLGVPRLGGFVFRGVSMGSGFSLEWRGGIFGGPCGVLGTLRESLGLLGDVWNVGDWFKGVLGPALVSLQSLRRSLTFWDGWRGFWGAFQGT